MESGNCQSSSGVYRRGQSEGPQHVNQFENGLVKSMEIRAQSQDAGLP
jgi:hypothetical protein